MIFCYPTAGKKKAFDICAAFAQGCGGEVVTDGVLRDGPAMFFGISEDLEPLWKAVQADGREFYYGDNSYIDTARSSYYRVTKNAVQHTGIGTSNAKRFDALGVPIMPWRQSGEHIVVTPQSDHFMRVVANWRGQWMVDMVAMINGITPRPLRLRPWSPNKTALASTLQSDLAGAHALVAHSSAAAITAVLSGVPIVVTGSTAARPMSGKLEEIESLPMASDEARRNWAGVLADQQWTLDEMRSGMAWRVLNEDP